MASLVVTQDEALALLQDSPLPEGLALRKKRMELRRLMRSIGCQPIEFSRTDVRYRRQDIEQLIKRKAA
jgi:hypothetical protein